MIVLDEQLSDLQIVRDFSRWYRGTVINITDLRPRTIVLDDAVPTLLRTVSNPTFVTINYKDFWQVVPAKSYYCVICLKLRQEEAERSSPMVRDLLNLSQYKTNRLRMGCVISVRNRIMEKYCV